MPLASSSSSGNRWAERKPIRRRRSGEPPAEARPTADPAPAEPASDEPPSSAADGPGTPPEEPALVPRLGEIGPVRREIIFEPLHERPAPIPVEPAPATPETRPEQPAEPVPAGS